MATPAGILSAVAIFFLIAAAATAQQQQQQVLMVQYGALDCSGGPVHNYSVPVNTCVNTESNASGFASLTLSCYAPPAARCAQFAEAVGVGCVNFTQTWSTPCRTCMPSGGSHYFIECWEQAQIVHERNLCDARCATWWSQANVKIGQCVPIGSTASGMYTGFGPCPGGIRETTYSQPNCMGAVVNQWNIEAGQCNGGWVFECSNTNSTGGGGGAGAVAGGAPRVPAVVPETTLVANGRRPH